MNRRLMIMIIILLVLVGVLALDFLNILNLGIL